MLLKELRHGWRILKELANFFKFAVRSCLVYYHLFGVFLPTLVNCYFEEFLQIWRWFCTSQKWLKILWHNSFKLVDLIYFLVFVSIEKIHQTLETVFHLISKHLEFRQKCSTTSCIFNSILYVWKSDETLSHCSHEHTWT